MQPTIQHHCALCQRVGGTDLVHRVPKRGFAVLRCQTCELVYTAAYPQRGTAHAIVPARTAGAPSSRYWSEDAIRLEERLFEFYRREARALLATLPESKGRLLDVGCSFGVLVDEARQMGFEAVGLEADATAAEFARQRFRLDVRAESLDQASFPAGSFDVVVLNDVIEHILDPLPFLAQVHRLLRPGGRVLLETPNHASLHAWLFGFANHANNLISRLTAGKVDHPWPGYYDFDPSQILQRGHVVHFTGQTLSHCLREAQFTSVTLHHQYSDTAYLLKRMPSVWRPQAGVVLAVQTAARCARSPNKLIAVATSRG